MSSTKPTNRPLVALVDCNNFYASCERVFNPKLQKRPVVVLSNNDGCIIARSNEAKVLGIPMGAPLFKYRQLINQHRIAVCSSNYTLYGDLSQRVMETLGHFSPHLQVYSIDEAFMLLDPSDCELIARQARKTVLQWVGIPVSIGIAPTKTLAKVANHVAKKDLAHNGVCALYSAAEAQKVLSELPVTEIWGIGSRTGRLLARYGIRTALQFAQADDTWIRKHTKVTGLRTALELRGQPCIPLEEAPPSKKSICSSRSFGKPINTLKELCEATSAYAARAAEKIRKQKCLASFITVFAVLHPFDLHLSSSIRITLPEPTNFTPHLISYAKYAIEQLYRPQATYRKVGILLEGLVPENNYQPSLSSTPNPNQTELMTLVDSLNKQYGRKVVKFAAEGINPTWTMQRKHCSPRYTTHWQELLAVRA